MKKLLRTTGKILLILLGLIGLLYIWILFTFYKKETHQYTFTPSAAIKPDSILILKGRHLAEIKGCVQCHGGNMAGKVMEDDPLVGKIIAPNLTSGEGGIGKMYNTSNWIMALQHGVGLDGRALKFMPSNETATLSTEDMSAIVSYFISLPPVDQVMEKTEVGPVAKLLATFDKIPVFAVELIDHSKDLVSKPSFKGPRDLGKYLSVSCIGCHRENLNGGDPFVPGGPIVPSITSKGNIASWSGLQFITALRTGTTPEGIKMDSLSMPWNMTAKYSDEELLGLYEYLRSIK